MHEDVTLKQFSSLTHECKAEEQFPQEGGGEGGLSSEVISLRARVNQAEGSKWSGGPCESFIIRFS